MTSGNPTTPVASLMRAAICLRVSTGRQAETDLEMPDQRRQIEAWAATRGHTIVDVFVEAGAFATDDKRPEFQRMIDRATDGENAVDLIVVGKRASRVLEWRTAPI